MNRRILLSFLIVTAGGFQGNLSAETVYKWVDENEKTHYSVNPPAAATSVTRFEIDPNGFAKSSALQETDRFHAIANQWKRINEERLQRQQLALIQAASRLNTSVSREVPRSVFDENASRNVTTYSRRVYRRHGYSNGRHYLHSYRPGGQPYISTPRSRTLSATN